MLNTKPSLPVRSACFPDELEANLRALSDAQLYRVIYIEPGRYSSLEFAATQREMDRRAIPLKVVSGYRSDQAIDKKQKSPTSKKYGFFSAEYQAFYFAIMGLVYVAYALVHHWASHKAITFHDLFQAFFRLCISAVIYIYLVFRSKPKPTRRK